MLGKNCLRNKVRRFQRYVHIFCRACPLYICIRFLRDRLCILQVRRCLWKRNVKTFWLFIFFNKCLFRNSNIFITTAHLAYTLPGSCHSIHHCDQVGKYTSTLRYFEPLDKCLGSNTYCWNTRRTCPSCFCPPSPSSSCTCDCPF